MDEVQIEAIEQLIAEEEFLEMCSHELQDGIED